MRSCVSQVVGELIAKQQATCRSLVLIVERTVGSVVIQQHSFIIGEGTGRLRGACAPNILGGGSSSSYFMPSNGQ